MENSRRRVRLLLRAVEILLLTIGLTSVGWYATVYTSSIREQAALSQELDRIVSQSRTSQRCSADLQVCIGAERGRPEGLRYETRYVKPQAVGVSSGLVGRIEVPRIKMSAVAREGVDVGTLRVAVGHIPGTALPGQPGNAGFAAHRDTFFRPLKSVREGDDILVTTPGGVYRYAVTSTQIVAPWDVSVLDSTTDAILTLVTCYPFEYIGNAPQRFIVRAALRGK